MIIDKYVKIKVNAWSVNRYIKLGYDVTKNRFEFEVKVLDLPKSSSVKINCRCSKCGKIKNIRYDSYNENTNCGENKYSCVDCRLEKIKKTNLQKYGVENVSQSTDIKNKKRETSLLRYDCEYPFQLEDVKSKIKKVNLKKFGVESPLQNIEVMNKLKQTNIKKYGVENVFQNKEIKEKIVTDNLEKFGVTNLNKLDSQKLKIKNSLINKYGVEHHFQLNEIKEKIKNTNLEKYGCENPNQNKDIREKSKITSLEKYGVEYPMQNLDIFNKQLKTSFSKKCFNNLFYQGTYELDFLKKFSHFDISKCDPIDYFFNNKKRKYYPDFYLKNVNLIVEIKSDYIYNKYLDINLAKKNACISQGYNFIFIINKDYTEFNNILNK